MWKSNRGLVQLKERVDHYKNIIKSSIGDFNFAYIINFITTF